jgi:hypothetical protein
MALFTCSPYLVHNKIRVVRRQVTNSRRNSRLTRLLSVHKRQSSKKVVPTLPRQGSSKSIGKESTHKVVEPYLKPVYGAVPNTSVLAASPDEHAPLLGNK